MFKEQCMDIPAEFSVSDLFLGSWTELSQQAVLEGTPDCVCLQNFKITVEVNVVGGGSGLPQQLLYSLSELMHIFTVYAETQNNWTNVS